MAVWKLSIQPDASPGYDPLAVCRTKGLVGVGWSYVFDKHSIRTKSDSYASLTAEEGRVPSAVARLADEVKAGDLVWLNQGGAFYLCAIEGSELLVGADISPDFRNLDLGHARRAAWAEVPTILVPGQVQRAVIVRRTLQRIDCNAAEEATFRYMHRCLLQNPAWLPTVDMAGISSHLRSVASGGHGAILTPDDYEDAVAGYLQSKGWMLVKSTCFRSKPLFEFLMISPGPNYAHVQVKSGSVPLAPATYAKWARPGETVFLLSAAPCDPYPGEPVKGVEPLSCQEVLEWLADNSWFITPGLRLRVQVVLDAAADDGIG